ncbi:MAG: hypothetical protein KJZ78_21495 [Bryobacteraceae bacterium]|nr:hypothetical protein [Bryobacteraceae bacterium]
MKTHYKEKLSGHLSYPVGLESVAAELGDIPQAEELSVRFVAHRDTATATERKRRVGQDYVVIAARFHHHRLGYSESNEMRDRGLYAPTWSLVVYAVSRRLRASVRSLLREHGIPEVKAWLQKPRPATWLQGTKEIILYVNELNHTVCVEETSDRKA